MSDFLQDQLGVSPQDKAKGAKTIGKLKSVATFLADAVKAVKDSTLVEAIGSVTPWWVSRGGKAIAESVPVVKLAVDLFSEWTKEHDPHVLGLLACTLAYQRSVEEVFSLHCTKDTAKKVAEDVEQKIAAVDFDAPVDFKSFSFHGALGHPFFTKATEQFEAFTKATGYKPDHVRILTGHIGRAFVRNLKTLLAHGKLRDKFRPFTDLMAMSTEESAYDTLLAHVEYTRWKFEEEPVFGKEPFALGHVYIGTECGRLTWGDTRRENRKTNTGSPEEPVDPFKEQCGGRHDLLQQVLDLMADPKLREPIVIQGVAGSGKSSFTLKLAAELGRRGFVPLRVRLKDLRLDVHVSEAIPQALFPSDQELPEYVRTASVDGTFLKRVATSEEVDLEVTKLSAKISRYVLILDGWDEISISSSEGFRIRVTRMLEQVYSEYLSGAGARIRVILTGRPSVDVEQSNVLRNATPLLTVRAIRPEQLREFVRSLRSVTEQKPLGDSNQAVSQWKVPEDTVFKPILDQYQKEYDAEHAAKNTEKPPSSSMEVLGLPLLAHLAIRLVSQWPGDCKELVSNPTTLYRSMIDLTCGNPGKGPGQQANLQAMHRVSGERLRKLLHRTAAAMTAYGSESISYSELSHRLGKEGDELERETAELVSEHELSALMIAYFFKGGHKDLGCEFLHKSFREYLFAEGIVEALKDFGRANHGPLEVRALYWKDFASGDPRHGFSRKLSYLLAPQWLSPEVVRHLENLLPWEIERATKPELWQAKTPAEALVLEPISVGQWEKVRDTLADLWDWWAEGVPLRPQPEKKRGSVAFRPPLTVELSEFSMPFDPNSSKELLPPRTATMDAHLGDGLFRLACVIHFQTAVQKGWLKAAQDPEEFPVPSVLWGDVTEIGKGPRRCQSKATIGKNDFTLFAPGGDAPSFFQNYILRVDAPAWRPSGPFPHGVDMAGVDLRFGSIAPRYTLKVGEGIPTTKWTFANLCDANGILGDFFQHEFSYVLANRVQLTAAYVDNARFICADLASADFGFTLGRFAIFHLANLASANLHQMRLENASFDSAKGSPKEFSPIGVPRSVPKEWLSIKKDAT